MIKRIKILFLLLSSLLVGDDYLDAVNMTVYSEYYYAGVMVELESILQADSYPKSLEFTLPVSTDSVFFISGIPSPESNVIPLPILSGDAYSTINLNLSDPQFRLFIFYTPFDDGSERSFSWPVKADIEMRNVHVIVQEPVMATDFSLLNEISTSEVDQHGAMMHQIHLGNIQADQLINVGVKYNNFSGKTTVQSLREQLSNSQESTSDQSFHEEIPVRHILLLWEPLVILGVLSFVIGMMVYSRRKMEIAGTALSCPSCNNGVIASDTYCPNCGEKLS